METTENMPQITIEVTEGELRYVKSVAEAKGMPVECAASELLADFIGILERHGMNFPGNSFPQPSMKGELG